MQAVSDEVGVVMERLRRTKEALMDAATINIWHNAVEGRMRRVVALWDATPWSFKKSVAFRLYNEAVSAYLLGNPAECILRLDAAERVLN